MAYTYQTALARGRTLDSVWQTVDLSAMDINVIYQTYSKVFLTLVNPIYPAPVYLDMDAVRAMIGVRVPGLTIPQWLAGLGTASLPTTVNPPTYVTQTVIFGDAWRAGYSVQPANHMVSPSSQLPTGALNDLYLTNPNVGLSLLASSALVSVNGFIHSTGLGPNGLYAYGGMSTVRGCDANQIGILSFENVGTLQQVPITPAMILNESVFEPYSGYVRVNLGQSLVGKSLLLVLGGHLHCFDDAYTIVGDGLVRINFDRIPWAETFYDSLNKIDTSSITWDSTTNDPEQISVSDLYSNGVIGAFLQLSQSFFVIVNTPDMYLLRHYAGRTKLPGRWTCAQGQQTFPLIGPMGRVVEYFPVWENTAFVLRSATQYKNHYMFETTDWKSQVSIAPKLNPRWPYSLPSVVLMELGAQQLTLPTA